MAKHRHGLVCGVLALVVAIGCTGEDTATESATTPTPDFPAAGSDAEPGQDAESDQTDANESKTSTGVQADAKPIDVKQISPNELQQLVAANRGKAVLVDFWATWCKPCVEQYPHTVELSKTHNDDLVVYTVSFDEIDDDSLARVKKFHADRGLGKVQPLISATGGDEESYEGFDITGGALPHYKLFDRDGNLATTFGGDVEDPIEPGKIDAAVKKLIVK